MLKSNSSKLTDLLKNKPNTDPNPNVNYPTITSLSTPSSSTSSNDNLIGFNKRTNQWATFEELQDGKTVTSQYNISEIYQPIPYETNPQTNTSTQLQSPNSIQSINKIQNEITNVLDYLRQTTYTKDVYGDLMIQLGFDLNETIKDAFTNQLDLIHKEKVLQRLLLIKSHLQSRNE